ncbi:hypothetical protein [Geothrix fuzhouensis]|uniref:hypothetical protein n=1 Tax=Geothrix fuzhouensis TaxID=2966451 RepID=UPI002147B554|nr:hypothetical protein [Geothrix fuzhouensis]
MAASSANLSSLITTDALFRSLFSPLSDALTAAGWSKVWNNIDWATVVKPTTPGTVAGSEVWAMQDSLQATAPLFLKVDYGTGTGATYPSLWVTVATGHDGAGNLTGSMTTRRLITITATANVYNCRFSGEVNRFCCWYGQSSTATNDHYGFSVERSHGSTGADTGDGALCLSFAYNTGFSQVLSAVGSVPVSYSHWNCTAPPTGTYADAADIYLAAVRGWGKGESSASLNFFMVFSADLSPSVSVPATLWDGTTHTIMPSANVSIPNTTLFYGGTVVLAMRFD